MAGNGLRRNLHRIARLGYVAALVLSCLWPVVLSAKRCPSIKAPPQTAMTPACDGGKPWPTIPRKK